MATRTAKDTLILLKKVLNSLLVEQLGIYVLGNGAETPSIAIRISEEKPSYKLKPDSGIECIIEPESDSEYRFLKIGGTSLIRRFTITLDQHNPRQTLADSLELIYSHPGIRPMEKPLVRPRLRYPNQQGEAPARALLVISEAQYLESVY